MSTNTETNEIIRSTLSKYAPNAFLVADNFIDRLIASEHDGHTYLEISTKEAKQLKQAYPIIGTGSTNTPIILWQNKLFWSRIFHFEKNIAIRLKEKAQTIPDNIPFKTAAEKLYQLFGTEDTNKQKQAAALAFLKNFILISGGPGTGKTTTVTKILLLLYATSQIPPRIMLAAPTGKAAARLTESLQNSLSCLNLTEAEKNYLTDIQGQTIHRLLRLNPITLQPYFNQTNPLPADVLVLDEASMLDLPLMLQTLQALKPDAKLILLGDKDQLPSIGAGALIQELFMPINLTQTTFESLCRLLPLHDLPNNSQNAISECSIELTESYRFDKNSAIGQLAKAIHTKHQKLNTLFDLYPDQLKLNQDNSNLIQSFFQQQKSYWEAVKHKEYQNIFFELSQVILLTALREDAENFNRLYLQFLEKQKLKKKDTPYFAGQCIMISSNDYLLKLYNGDIGVILPNEKNELTAYFLESDQLKTIAISRLPAHETAFAYTVHKSQGSEFEQVWLLAPSIETPLFNQALLYTTITRAKTCFAFWGSLQSLQNAVKTNTPRKSALQEMLLSS